MNIIKTKQILCRTVRRFTHLQSTKYMKFYFCLRTDKMWELDKLMQCSSKKQPVENLTSWWSFTMKITAKENDINNTQLSYKHWVSFKNRCALDFKRMSTTNEDFDSGEHCIPFFLFITCDLWWFSFRWVCVPLVPCQFRDCQWFVPNLFCLKLTFFNRFSAGHFSRSWAHGAVGGFG